MSRSVVLLLASASAVTSFKAMPRLVVSRPHYCLTAPMMGEGGGLFGRFRKKRTVEKADPIVAGMALPSIEVDALLFDDDALVVGIDSNATDVPAAVLPIGEALGNGTTVLVGMPGAFTPTCNDEHLPGYVNSLDRFKELGVERVAVITTNDRYVNNAWRSAIEACMQKKSGVLMLSDGDGDLVKALGLVDDMGYGLGVRSQRFALVVESGVVKHVAVDEGMSDLATTSAEAIIELLTPATPDLPAAGAIDVDPKVVGAVAVVLIAALIAFGAGLAPSDTLPSGFQGIP